MAARTPKTGPKTMCRGRWSKCGGKFPSRSESWHLCQACTVEYWAMKKAEKASKAAPAPAAKPARARKSQKVDGASDAPAA